LARDKYWASYSDDAGSEPIDLEAEEEKLLAERIEVESITLTQHSMTLLAGGDSADLDVIFDPKDATDKSVTYESSNPEVASVSSNGTVTPGHA
ncbi:MAG: Ig-like domain-containing protein, partial [Lachnospiraceae bacterium]|nr:Ig-like domain-containing protein [Lachnospiraceae bacterium]